MVAKGLKNLFRRSRSGGSGGDSSFKKSKVKKQVVPLAVSTAAPPAVSPVITPTSKDLTDHALSDLAETVGKDMTPDELRVLIASLTAEMERRGEETTPVATAADAVENLVDQEETRDAPESEMLDEVKSLKSVASMTSIKSKSSASVASITSRPSSAQMEELKKSMSSKHQGKEYTDDETFTEFYYNLVSTAISKAAGSISETGRQSLYGMEKDAQNDMHLFVKRLQTEFQATEKLENSDSEKVSMAIEKALSAEKTEEADDAPVPVPVEECTGAPLETESESFDVKVADPSDTRELAEAEPSKSMSFVQKLLNKASFASEKSHSSAKDKDASTSAMPSEDQTPVDSDVVAIASLVSKGGVPADDVPVDTNEKSAPTVSKTPSEVDADDTQQTMSFEQGLTIAPVESVVSATRDAMAAVTAGLTACTSDVSRGMEMATSRGDEANVQENATEVPDDKEVTVTNTPVTEAAVAEKSIPTQLSNVSVMAADEAEVTEQALVDEQSIADSTSSKRSIISKISMASKRSFSSKKSAASRKSAVSVASKTVSVASKMSVPRSVASRASVPRSVSSRKSASSKKSLSSKKSTEKSVSSRQSKALLDKEIEETTPEESNVESRSAAPELEAAVETPDVATAPAAAGVDASSEKNEQPSSSAAKSTSSKSKLEPTPLEASIMFLDASVKSFEEACHGIINAPKGKVRAKQDEEMTVPSCDVLSFWK